MNRLGLGRCADALRPLHAAVCAPAYLAGDGWRTLLVCDAHHVTPSRFGWMAPALALLRVLRRLPRSPWRSTCLYRSVASCLVLRAAGTPAVLRLGVRRDGSDATARVPARQPSFLRGGIRAHAWVEHAGSGALLYGSRTGFVPLDVHGADRRSA